MKYAYEHDPVYESTNYKSANVMWQLDTEWLDLFINKSAHKIRHCVRQP
jgi:hypothetical protein